MDHPEIPTEYQGLDRYNARREIWKIYYRGNGRTRRNFWKCCAAWWLSGVVIEPWLLDQWYVNAEKLANPRLKQSRRAEQHLCLNDGTKPISSGCGIFSLGVFHGSSGGDIVFRHGMALITTFCWDFRGRSSAAAAEHYGKSVELTRDNDVLDTWFSSGLWPFSTLGWPEQTNELERYYPVMFWSLVLILFFSGSPAWWWWEFISWTVKCCSAKYIFMRSFEMKKVRKCRSQRAMFWIRLSW